MAKEKYPAWPIDKRTNRLLWSRYTDRYPSGKGGTTTIANGVQAIARAALRDSTVKVSHSAVRQVLDYTSKTCWFLPYLAAYFGIPEYQIVYGLSDDERRLILAYREVADRRPGRAPGFVEQTLERAADITGQEVSEILSKEPQPGDASDGAAEGPTDGPHPGRPERR